MTTTNPDLVADAIQAVALLSVRKPTELKYACSLAAALYVPIKIFVGGGSLPHTIENHQKLLRLQSKRLQTAVPGIRIIDSLVDQPGLVIVGNSITRKETSGHSHHRLIMMAPHEEAEFDSFNRRKILVPFGQPETTLKELYPALHIAKKTNAKIVLYHTTRPDPKLVVDEHTNWFKHMVTNASNALEQSAQTCNDHGVAYEVEVTSVYPREIAEGIADAAYKHDCHLIVMAVADDVVFGSHTIQVLDYAPIPTLIVA